MLLIFFPSCASPLLRRVRGLYAPMLLISSTVDAPTFRLLRSPRPLPICVQEQHEKGRIHVRRQFFSAVFPYRTFICYIFDPPLTRRGVRLDDCFRATEEEMVGVEADVVVTHRKY